MTNPNPKCAPFLRPLTDEARGIIKAQRRKPPDHAGLVEKSDWSDGPDYAECPWCEEGHSDPDNNVVCTHCGKAFDILTDGDGDTFSRPLMTRQDQDYLDWLNQKNRSAAA